MLRRILIFIVVIGFLSVPLISLGQDTPDEDPPCGEPFGEPCIPIDGGLSFLIAAGVAYGGKKAHDIYKKR